MLIFLATGLSAGVPWHRLDKRWIAVIPVLDLIGIIVAREGAPLLGVTFLLVFPVIWLATHFGARGAAGSVVLATLLLYGVLFLRGEDLPPDEIPRLAILPVVLAFLAATTYATTRRAAAQRVLLTQQAVLFEDALRRSTRQKSILDALFNSVDFGVVGFDIAGRTNFINRAQRELFSRFGADDNGHLAHHVVFHEDRVTPYSIADTPYQRALRGETIDRLTVWLGKPGTPQLAVLISARPILDEKGNTDGGIMVTRDVTAEIRAITARDDLVASVSHELRTPLTSILGYLELSLDDDSLDPSTRRMLEVASKNADRLLALVADLLTTASTAKNELTIVSAPCTLDTIVAEAVESLAPLAAERSIRFVQGLLPVVQVSADAFRLRQVVDNVLSNAVKYNVAAGSISVTLSATIDSAELRVTDTGRGMTDDEQQNLFNRFYRADSVRGSSVHGTGLGLNISREIMRRHGGDLRLESTFGVGTTAIATLPIRAAHAEAAP
nr:sensor histidine kinase [Cryobacterium roopkundense]